MRKSLIAVLLCVLLMPVICLADEPVTIGDAVFDKALAEGRLCLELAPIVFAYDATQVAAEYSRMAEGYQDPADMPWLSMQIPGKVWAEDTLYRDFLPLSLSPDGAKVLGLVEQLPMILDFATSRVILPWVPAAGASEENIAWMQALVRGMEPYAISWSQDGSALSFAFPSWTLKQLRGANLWLSDLAQGTTIPLMDVPPRLSMGDIRKQALPYRAVFDTKDPVLYYDVLGAQGVDAPDDYPAAAIYAYDLSRGEASLHNVYSGGWTSLMPLYATKHGLFTNTSNIRRDEGAALYQWLRDGSYTMTQLNDPEDPATAFLTEAVTTDVRGTRAALLRLQTLFSSTPSLGMLVLDIDALEDSATALGTLHGIELDAAGKPSWVTHAMADQPSLAEGNPADMVKATMDKIASGRVLVPRNAVFSPDGKYLLVVADNPIAEILPRLYLVNLQTQAVSQVAVEGADARRIPTFLGAYDTPGTNADRGLQWVGGNRLLINDGGGSRIYRFGVTE